MGVGVGWAVCDTRFCLPGMATPAVFTPRPFPLLPPPLLPVSPRLFLVSGFHYVFVKASYAAVLSLALYPAVFMAASAPGDGQSSLRQEEEEGMGARVSQLLSLPPPPPPPL